MPGHPRVLELAPEEEDLFGPEESGCFDFYITDRRGFQRALLNAEAAIRFYAEDCSELCSGHARLRDLSLDGALMTEISIERTIDGTTPDQLGTFETVVFRVVEGPFVGVEAEAVPVRLASAEAGIGLKLTRGFHFAA